MWERASPSHHPLTVRSSVSGLRLARPGVDPQGLTQAAMEFEQRLFLQSPDKVRAKAPPVLARHIAASGDAKAIPGILRGRVQPEID